MHLIFKFREDFKRMNLVCFLALFFVITGDSSKLQAQWATKSGGAELTYRETRSVEKLTAERVSPKEKTVQEVSPRIVGGKDVTDDEYPWMVGLLSRGESDNFMAHFCGASLIHPYWVLTAAHCVEGDRPEDLDVLIGATDLGISSQGERIPVDEIIIHPEYDSIAFENDIALLRLGRPSSTPTLRLISDLALEQPDTLATVIGWGALDEENTSFPEVLQEAIVPLVSLDEANAPSRYDGGLTANMLAAGNLSEGGVDTCQGDSGGPLLLEDIDGEWTLAGVVSFGEGCARPELPGIYTRVSQFRGWALQYVMPEYHGWELSNNVFGEDRDLDGDRLSNFLEFSFAQNPKAGAGAGIEVLDEEGGPVFSFLRPKAAGSESSYKLFHMSDLSVSVWDELDFEETLTSTQDLVDEERLTFEFPSGNRGFVRIEANWAESLSHTTRPLRLNQSAFSSLTDNLRFDASNRPYQEFLIEDVDGGSRFLYLESENFDLRFELYDPAGGQLLSTLNRDNLNVSDELYEFSPSVPVLLRVLPNLNSGRGPYSIYFSDSERVSLETIGENESVSGQLTTESEFDPLFLPDEYYKQDYVLETPPGLSIPVIVTLTSNDFDAYLELIDIATGQALAFNDNIGGANRSARLAVQPFDFGFVLIRVTTAAPLELGSFVLSTEPKAETVDPDLETIGENETVSGQLTTQSDLDPLYLPDQSFYKHDYLLETPSEFSTPVVVTLASNDFDAYLEVIDILTGNLLDENDDISESNFNSRLTVQPSEFGSVLIRVTSTFESQTGSFTLTTQPE